jgi:hypothetical protein
MLMEDLQMERSTEPITSATVGRVISAFGGGVGRRADRSVPVLPVTDALVVAAVTGNVLLVIGPKANTRPAITSARQQVDRVGTRILGGIRNRPQPSLAPASCSY